MQNIIKEYFTNLYSIQLDNLNEKGEFVDSSKLPKSSQD